MTRLCSKNLLQPTASRGLVTMGAKNIQEQSGKQSRSTSSGEAKEKMRFPSLGLSSHTVAIVSIIATTCPRIDLPRSGLFLFSLKLMEGTVPSSRGRGAREDRPGNLC